jgi:hypothetical protein
MSTPVYRDSVASRDRVFVPFHDWSRNAIFFVKSCPLFAAISKTGTLLFM